MEHGLYEYSALGERYTYVVGGHRLLVPNCGQTFVVVAQGAKDEARWSKVIGATVSTKNR